MKFTVVLGYPMNLCAGEHADTYTSLIEVPPQAHRPSLRAQTIEAIRMAQDEAVDANGGPETMDHEELEPIFCCAGWQESLI